LELNYFDAERRDFVFVNNFNWSNRIKLRSFYFNPSGDLVVRHQQTSTYEGEIFNAKLSEVVEEFFSQVFEHMLGLK
jgi:hypothetical protein